MLAYLSMRMERRSNYFFSSSPSLLEVRRWKKYRNLRILVQGEAYVGAYLHESEDGEK